MRLWYYLDKGRDGHIVPVVGIDGKEIHLGSCYDGEYASKQWMKYHVAEGTEYAILFGVGDGQLLMQLGEQVPGYIIVYEPDPNILKMVSQTEIYRKLKSEKRIMICCGEAQFSEFEELVQELLNEDCVDTTCMLAHPGYRKFYEKEFGQVISVYNRVLEEIFAMKGSIQRFLEARIHNQLLNLPCMKNGVLLPRLKDYWNPEIPIIIVSAGPSLEKNLLELKRVCGRALIFSVDAALSILLENDIVPDLVGCTDATKNMECFSVEGSSELPLLVVTNSPASLIQKSTGPKIWGDDLAFVREILTHCDVDIPKIPSYLGVSTTLFAIALELGARQIVLVGQDLAYSTVGKSHISGRDEGFVKDERFKTEGYYGGEVWSRYDWMVFREWFEDAIAVFADREIINATEGGAKIHGAVQKDLKDVIDNFSVVEIKWHELLNCQQVKMSPKEYQRVMREYHKSKDDLHKICEQGYSKTFFETNYMSLPVMRLVIEYMKSLNEGNREERFNKAVEYLCSAFENDMK